MLWVLIAAVIVALWLRSYAAHARSGGVVRGLASRMTVTRSMSATAVRRGAYVTRPTTHIHRSTPPRQVGIEVGETGRWKWTRRKLYAGLRQIVLVIAPPEAGKTGFLGRAVQDASGAVLAASTRSDLYEKTITSRHRRPVYVFNPYDVGGIPNTLRWSPIHGCADRQYAMRTAGLLVTAGAHGGQKDAEFWEDQAVKALRCLLAAADLAGEDMHEVVRWAGDLTSTRPTTILERGGMGGWAADLRDIKAMPEKTRGSLSTTLSTSLQFMSVPTLAELATPTRDEQFDPRKFIRTGASAYVIGRHREHDPVAPLFSALFTTITDTAADLAERCAGQRLDPPLTLVLDEVTNIFRVPLDELTSFAGGLGMPMVIAAQGHHQLRKAFGVEGAKAVWSNAAVKVAFGGDLDEETLKMLSLLCGSKQPVIGSHERVPVLRTDQIQHLDDGQILVLRRNTPPILAWSQPVWERTDPPVAEPLVPDVDKPAERHLYVVKEAS